MQNKLDVTRVETPYPKGKILVSRTDLQGVTTYANDAFIEISGFPKDKLIGHPHNVVRHPDMPSEVFADMWHTIQSGYPFRGLIKNLRKDGGFYWVDAMIVPVFRNGKRTGYMSVRLEPSRSDIQQAEQYYAAVREKRVKYKSPIHHQTLSFNTKWGILLLVMVTLVLLNVFAPNLGIPAWATWVLIGVSALGAIIGIFSANSIKKQFLEMYITLKAMAEGDLTSQIDITGRDDMGKMFASLAAMQVQLQVIIDDIREASQNVSNEIVELESDMNTVVDTMESQKEAVFQVHDVMDRSNQSSREVVENSRMVLSAVAAAGGQIVRGRQGMDHSSAALKAVIHAVKESEQSLAQMKNSLGQISQISHAITDIAEQTNLLALNAAIEAARAGDAGRGFAVVADEVRKLAEKTSGSTSEITSTVDTIQNTTQAAISSMEDGVEHVHECQKLLDYAATQFEAIEVGGQQVQASSSIIADTTQEQSVASQEIANSLEGVAKMCEDSSQAAGVVKSATHSLVQTASDLMALVHEFKLTRTN